MDMLLNSLNHRDAVQNAFPLESLEMFKPVVNILKAMLSWHGRLVEMKVLTSVVEAIKMFFEHLKGKLYSGVRSGTVSANR